MRSDEILAHWFFPYFIIAALRISSSVFFQMPPAGSEKRGKMVT